MRLVIALGGNALLDPEQPQTIANQQEQINTVAPALAPILEEHDVILTHGNGPQVGNLMRQQEQAPPKRPLDVLVAETQAQIGYMLTQALERQDVTAPTTLTRVVVDPASDAFDTPTKPVGPFLSAAQIEDRPGTYRELGDGETPYRRVVPSPAPQRIRELPQIRDQLGQRDSTIACGGGGIPITPAGDGVEAVIDKDASSALLAREIEADKLILLTDVPYIYRDYGTDSQEPIEHVDVTANPFDSIDLGEGSMKPKAEAAKRFTEETGNEAIIGSLDNLENVIEGKGTVFEADH